VDDLSFALALADLADSISLPRFRASDLAVETKADLTPVTDADRAVERSLRERIDAERPGEGVLGEEEGGDGAWILDPIDGTKNYSRGVPVWATLIALRREGEVEVGVVSAPALGRRWWALRGRGAFADGARIRVSRVTRLEDAVFAYTEAPERRAEVAALAARVWHARGLGDFWSHVLVAEGAVDAAVDPVVGGVWDTAALAVIVEEAGGRSSDLAGERRIDGGNLVSSNGLLHDAVLEALAPP
jgi:histidinol-phosphatase